MKPHGRSRREELANALTHAAGAALGCAALVSLLVLAAVNGDAWHVVSGAVYGVSLVLLYAFSATYHALRHERAKRVFRTLDHVAIYVLIAGTYTPFLLVTLRGGWGWSLLGVLWGLAAAGIVLEVAAPARFRMLAVPVYLLMGWLAIVALRPLFQRLEPGGMAWVFAGGLAYTVGVVFYAMKRVPYAHTVWHAFVLGGSVCHFLAVLLYVMPRA